MSKEMSKKFEMLPYLIKAKASMDMLFSVEAVLHQMEAPTITERVQIGTHGVVTSRNNEGKVTGTAQVWYMACSDGSDNNTLTARAANDKVKKVLEAYEVLGQD